MRGINVLISQCTLHENCFTEMDICVQACKPVCVSVYVQVCVLQTCVTKCERTPKCTCVSTLHKVKKNYSKRKKIIEEILSPELFKFEKYILQI